MGSGTSGWTPTGRVERRLVQPVVAGLPGDGGAGQLQRHCGKTLQYFGDVWYQRSVWVPPGWQGRRIVLHLESATHRATVWVNDVEVMSHEGGYTPFEADITDHVTPGEEVRITALINNTLHWQSIPPGVIEDTPAGKRQRYWHNFFNYAGIHRTVWLYATDPAHISDVMITSDLDGDTGVINYTECGVVEHRKRAGI
jgi:beta-glucuronidase